MASVPVPAMAIEVYLSEHVPNSQSGFTTNPNPYNTPPPTGNIVPPQSPSGSVTGQAATFNFTNTITSTKEYVSSMIAARNVGTSFNFNEGTPPSPPGFNIAQTLPVGPGGAVVEGTPAISNVTSITASFGGISPAAIQVFKWV